MYYRDGRGWVRVEYVWVAWVCFVCVRVFFRDGGDGGDSGDSDGWWSVWGLWSGLNTKIINLGCEHVLCFAFVSFFFFCLLARFFLDLPFSIVCYCVIVFAYVCMCVVLLSSLSNSVWGYIERVCVEIDWEERVWGGSTFTSQRDLPPKGIPMRAKKSKNPTMAHKRPCQVTFLHVRKDRSPLSQSHHPTLTTHHFSFDFSHAQKWKSTNDKRRPSVVHNHECFNDLPVLHKSCPVVPFTPSLSFFNAGRRNIWSASSSRDWLFHCLAFALAD